MAQTVLIVDDVAFVRQTLSEILTEAGYQVIAEAADGQQAVEMYRKHRPDVVTMDVVMPNMSGIEATRKLLKAEPSARVIMVTAMGQENLIMEAINSGARDYITKPFSADLILKTLERVLMGDEETTSRNRTTGEHSI